MANDFYRNPIAEDLVSRLTQTALEYCSNERFAERFRREDENWYQWWAIKYFLYEYEEYLAENTREDAGCSKDSEPMLTPRNGGAAWR